MTTDADPDGTADAAKPDPDAERPDESKASGPKVKEYGARFVVVVALVAALVGVAAGYVARSSASGASVATDGPSPLAPIIPLKLGQTGTTEKGAKVTVLSWSDKGRPPSWPFDSPGYQWSRAEVKFCTSAGTWNFRIREVPYLFNLVTTDGKLINPVVDGSHNLDELASYNIGLLSPQTCITGSIIFSDPTEADIKAIRFTGNGRFEWDVAAIANGSSPAPSPSYGPGLSGPGAETILPPSDAPTPTHT